MQVNVYKDPVTDPGKMSRRGRMTLELDDSGQYVTRTEGSGDPHKVRGVVTAEEQARKRVHRSP